MKTEAAASTASGSTRRTGCTPCLVAAVTVSSSGVRIPISAASDSANPIRSIACSGSLKAPWVRYAAPR